MCVPCDSGSTFKVRGTNKACVLRLGHTPMQSTPAQIYIMALSACIRRASSSCHASGLSPSVHAFTTSTPPSLSGPWAQSEGAARACRTPWPSPLLMTPTQASLMSSKVKLQAGNNRQGNVFSAGCLCICNQGHTTDACMAFHRVPICPLRSWPSLAWHHPGHACIEKAWAGQGPCAQY